MAEIETALICLSFVLSVGIGSYAAFNIVRMRTEIQQRGISERAGIKATAMSPKEEWWVPILTELLKNPEMQNVVISLVKQFPEITTKFALGQIKKE